MIRRGPPGRQWAEHGRDGGDAAGPAGDPRGHCGQGSGPGQQKGTMQSLEKVVAQSQLLGLSNEGLTTTLQPLQAVPLGTVVSPVVRAPADRGPWAISAAWKAGCAEQSHT